MSRLVIDPPPRYLDETAFPWEAWSSRPYLQYASSVGRDRLESLWRGQLRSLAAAGHFLGLESEGRLAAAGIWRPAPWDTEQLGLAAGTLDVLAVDRDAISPEEAGTRLVDEVLRQAGRRSLAYLICRLGADDTLGLMALQKRGFILLDGILTFSVDLASRKARPPEDRTEIRPATEDDLADLVDIARRSYVHDRFHHDPLIDPETADRLHGVWIANCLRRKVADEVLVAQVNGRVAGYVSCRLDRDAAECLGQTIGIIVLVATHPDYRRRGVARAVTVAALDWFDRAGARWVEVGTQLANISASRLYLEAGFSLVRTSLSLRFGGDMTPGR